ncbi:hypothetical protein PSECIP111951_00017 [Pseudoalteromonas holothuriae]|uniref:Uncharacterized protein n=1 Tax=Pseudoalteromonas holothuriae TaxID=2963714 RepID=A0ABM9GD22_9GAMM|nr:leucine-rich repeat domain-containing protein [Pseudoalteromonas sp. CIP111951]CAH9049740.1 hypothetical protein PSECIP111951_00017 [Pseudoalteromonas sp. CIP111951]
MKPVLPTKGLALSLLTLALTACGGSGGNDTTKTPDNNEVTTPVTPEPVTPEPVTPEPVTPEPITPEPINQAPIIEAAEGLQSQERDTFAYTAQASDADGAIASYSWEQTAGTDVVLSGIDTSTVEFIAPDIIENENITLKLTVVDDKDAVTSQEFTVALNAYAQPTAELITDSALLSCIQSAELDLGATNIECKDIPITQITDLAKFTQLKSLLIENSKLESIENLSSLTQLESVTLNNNSITDYSPVNALNNLTELSFSINSQTEFETIDLSNFNKLVKLAIKSNDNYVQFDLSVLPTTLTQLSLHNVYNVSASDLTPFTQIEKLSLTNIDGIKSLSFLTKMPNIQEFKIQYLNAYDSVNDPSAFAVTPNLTKLALINIDITDYDFLSNLPLIEDLEITKNYLSSGDTLGIEKINELKNLTSLKLNKIQLENHDKLSQFSNLKELQLDNNHIATVSFLESLNALEKLVIKNNEIVDIAWLKYTPKIEHLTIEDLSNDINFSVLESLTSLKYLELIDDDYYGRTFDAQKIAQLERLENVRLKFSQISNLDQLTSFTKLNSLYLKQQSFSTLPSITNLPALKSLTLENRSSNQDNKVVDLANLGTSQSLETLKLAGFNNVADLSHLSEFTALKKLNLHDFATSDISPISTLSQLETLTLSSFNSLIFVESLTQLTNLYYLDIDNNYYFYCTDVDALKSKFADIADSEFPHNCVQQPVDYSLMTDENLKTYMLGRNMKDIASITELHINTNEISSIAGIEQLENLAEIRFRHTKDFTVLDPSIINQLPQLQKLSFNQSNFSDLNGLQLPNTVTDVEIYNHNTTLNLDDFSAPQLTNLNLSWTNLSSTSALSSFINLTNLNLYSSEIKDLSPLFSLTKLQILNLQQNSQVDCNQFTQLKEKLVNTNIYSPYQCN